MNPPRTSSPIRRIGGGPSATRQHDALGLILNSQFLTLNSFEFDRNQVTSPENLSELVPGELILFDLREHGNPYYTGYTMIVLENDPDKKEIIVGEGHISGAPVEMSTYTYDEILGKWKGPVVSKGRKWCTKCFGN